MAKNIRNSSDRAFETRQIHIGQKQTDPATGVENVDDIIADLDQTQNS